MVHVVLQHALTGFAVGEPDDVQRVRSFLIGLEDGLLALPGFTVHAPGIPTQAWTLRHRASFETWRGDIPVHLLSIDADETLTREQARHIVRRMGSVRLYAYCGLNGS